jgi:hypothetical protein
VELDFDHCWPVLQGILQQAEGPLTRRALLQWWPAEAPTPARMTLWKWLSRAVEEDRVLRDGAGHRKDPYHYWLPGMIEKWQKDFLDSFMKRLDRDEERNAPPR